MADIVERLQASSDSLCAHFRTKSERPRALQEAVTVERLAAAEIELLRAALAPFARIEPSDLFSDDDNEAYTAMLFDATGRRDFTRADLIRAKAALNPTNERTAEGGVDR